MNVPLTLLASLLTLIPGPQTIRDQARPQAIYGGEAAAGQWPAVVRLDISLSEGGPRLCTGTIIAEDLVLTAAHCLVDAQSVVVTAEGESGGTEQLDIVSPGLTPRWGLSPDYDASADTEIEDFAWLSLSPGVTSDAGITPLEVLRDQAEYDAAMALGAPLTMVGYGLNDVDGTQGDKYAAETELVSHSATGREFGAGGDGKDSCTGDSGGPALVDLGADQWRLAGVLSRGPADCEGRGVYGLAAPQLCWVVEASGLGAERIDSSCASCDCLVLRVGDEGVRGCQAGSTPVQAPASLVLAVLVWLRRREGRRVGRY